MSRIIVEIKDPSRDTRYQIPDDWQAAQQVMLREGYSLEAKADVLLWFHKKSSTKPATVTCDGHSQIWHRVLDQ